ncbi:MAG: DUF4956 domain-containing protein [Saprospiraceae bacterium]|nr:DUF4956 domain-containing protein [Saprospiraceae bacterium]
MSLNYLYGLEEFCISIGLNLIIAIIVIKRLQASDLLAMVTRYNLLLFNLFIFLLCYILTRMELSVGAGLGLFALLGILRIRSEVIKIEGLIGLLFLMSIGFIHSVYPQVLHLWQLVVVDIILLAISVLHSLVAGRTICIRVKLKDLKLLHAGRQKELSKSLEEKLGLRIKSIVILNININEDCAHLRVSLDCTKYATGDLTTKSDYSPYKDIIRLLPKNGLKKDFIT